MQHSEQGTHSSRPDRGRRRRRRRQARRRLLLLAAVVVIAAVAVGVLLLHGRGGAGASGAGNDGATAVATKSKTPPPKVWAASAVHPVKVWVGGDSMGGELGFALRRVLEDARVFSTATFYKESTGICRYDFFDWQREIDTVMKRAKPQAAVIMLGTNDTQAVWRDGTWIPYGKIAWKRAYARRVGDLMDTMLAGGARRVYWVGMPIMGQQWRTSRMKLIDEVFREQAAKRPGAEYIDIWGLFTNPDGSFDPSLRAADGVHFTGEGQALVAETVYAAIKADWHPVEPESPSPSVSASPSAP